MSQKNAQKSLKIPQFLKIPKKARNPKKSKKNPKSSSPFFSKFLPPRNQGPAPDLRFSFPSSFLHFFMMKSILQFLLQLYSRCIVPPMF